VNIPAGRGLVSSASKCIAPPAFTPVRLDVVDGKLERQFPRLVVSSVKCASFAFNAGSTQDAGSDEPPVLTTARRGILLKVREMRFGRDGSRSRRLAPPREF